MPDKTSLVTLHAGRLAHEFEVRPETWDVSILSDVFSRDEYGLVSLARQKPDVKFILDIGAHIGGFSALALLLWPGATLMAFEPDPANFEMLRKNMRVFMGQRVVLCNVAVVGEEFPGQKIFGFRPAAGPTAFNTGSGALDENGTRNVLGFPVSRAYTTAHPDLVKIDTEGLEVEIVKGIMQNNLLGVTGTILGEWHGFAKLDALKKQLGGVTTHHLRYELPPQGKDCSLFFMDPVGRR